MTDLSRLSESDLSVLNALAVAGAHGLCREDLRAACAAAGIKGSAKDFLDRVRLRGHAVAAMRVGYHRGAHVYSYVLAAPEGAPAAAPRFVTRVVSGDLGLGATPGARVSVPFVSFLDAVPPRAPAGRGEG